MNFLSAENLSKRLGDRVLFTQLNLGIAKGEKKALVAKNGTGKTTLLKILAGKETSDTGQVVTRRGIRIGYLAQDPVFDSSKGILENLLAGEAPAIQAVRVYEECLQAHNHDPNNLKHIEALSEAGMKLDQYNAWDIETKLHQLLERFKLDPSILNTATLSGGQKKRLALVQLMVDEPDLMILDEPTNHLDIEMCEWLEEWLSQSHRTVILVTHDRYFLEGVCDTILEMEDGQLYSYSGNYSYFLEMKSARELQQQSEIDKAKNQYRKELEWIRRMPKARTTKSKARIDAFQGIEEKALTQKDNSRLELGMKMTRLGNKILSLDHVSLTLGEKKLIHDFSYTFRKGERTGIIGPNGIGKSTFLNLIQGILTPDEGVIETGETLVFGYYHQSGIQLQEDKRVIDVITDIAEYIELSDGSKLGAQQLLNKFLFTRDMPFSPVSRLSGGERRRLFLLTLIIRNPNFLILDEPTNDLDLSTIQVLEDFLENFPGNLIIVSHDRYFMDRLTDNLLVFEGKGKITPFTGTYSDWRILKDAPPVIEKIVIPPAQNNTVSNNISANKLNYKEKMELKEIEEIHMPQLEENINKLENLLSEGNEDYLMIQKWAGELEINRNKHAELESRWLELSEKS